MKWGLCVLLAFVLGSLPWGLWVGKLVAGIDVRRQGSGNLGATNVYRVLGPRWGITVLLLDAAKGVAAVLVAQALMSQAGGGPTPTPNAANAEWAGVAAMVSAVFGHSFSPFAGFRGGKGVATAAGAWGALAPLPLAAAVGVWILVFALTRIVSAGSVAAGIALPVAVLLLGEPGGPPGSNPLFWAAVLTAFLLLARHRANLVRLVRGEEAPLRLRPRKESRP